MARRDDASEEEQALSRFGRVMRERGRPFRVVPFPGAAGETVALRCPTEAELTEADTEARKYLTKHLGLSALDLSLAQETELVKRERQLELLALVLRDPQDPEQAYAESVSELREHLEEPQRRALIDAMEEFQRERFAQRTPQESAEIVRLVRDLKAAGALSNYWTSCDSDTQLAILEALLESGTPTAPSSSATS